MTKPNREVVQPSFMLNYVGSDNKYKVRILSEDALSSEFNDTSVVLDNEDMHVVSICELNTDVKSTVFGGITLDMVGSAINIVCTKNMSWNEFFNKSKQHHWESLYCIIVMCIYNNSPADIIDLKGELESEPEHLAVVPFEKFMADHIFQEIFHLSYFKADGTFWWRFLSKDMITEAKVIDNFSYSTKSDNWLNASPFKINGTSVSRSEKLCVQISLPEGYLEWDGILDELTSSKCKSLFTEIETHYNNPELRKVIHFPDFTMKAYLPDLK